MLTNYRFSVSRKMIAFFTMGMFVLVNIQTLAQQKTNVIVDEEVYNLVGTLKNKIYSGEAKGQHVKIYPKNETKGDGNISSSCIGGISYKYTVESNYFNDKGKPVVATHLHAGILKFKLHSSATKKYTVIAKKIRPVIYGWTQWADTTSHFVFLPQKTNDHITIVGLKDEPSIIKFKITKIIMEEVVKLPNGDMGTRNVVIPCSETMVISLPAAIKAPELVEGVDPNDEVETHIVLPKAAESKGDEASGDKKKEISKQDEFWNGKQSTVKSTEKKQDDFWNSKQSTVKSTEKKQDDFWNGKEKEVNKNENNATDFWSGATEEDLKANYKATKSSGKNGYIDERGNKVIDDIFDFCYDFKENFGRVKTDKGFGFINKKGKFINTVFFDDARDFSNGMAAVMKNKKWGFINKTGQVAVPCTYDEVEEFKNDFAIGSMIDNTIKESGEYNYFTLFLKTRYQLSKSNTILSKEKIAKINNHTSLGFSLLVTDGYAEWAKTKTQEEIKADKAERAKIRNEESKKEYEKIKENLKSQAESSGYRFIEN